MIDPGTHLSFRYPVSTHVRYLDSVPCLTRDITVKTVRDLVAEPLTTTEFLRRPYVLRSRWLVRAVDHETQEFRQFYLGSSPDFAAPATLRIALYDPGSTRPRKYLAREFAPTVKERKLMLRLIRHYIEYDWGDLQIRITADDLRVRF